MDLLVVHKLAIVMSRARNVYEFRNLPEDKFHTLDWNHLGLKLAETDSDGHLLHLVDNDGDIKASLLIGKRKEEKLLSVTVNITDKDIFPDLRAMLLNADGQEIDSN